MLDTLLTDVRHRRPQFTVYRAGEETALEAQFATHNVSVDTRPLPPSVPAPFLVIEKDDAFAGAIALEDVETLLEPPIVRPGERDDVSEGYRVFFDVLDDTVFTALNRRQLLAVSREIEERAYRVGTGTLHASFQRFSVFESQVDVYRDLATHTNLEIYIHGSPDWEPPAIAGITYQPSPDASLERYWALAYDGGDADGHACGLLTKERRDEYDGFWTDDEALVSRLVRAFSA